MSESLLILAVDRNERNLALLTDFLCRHGYATLCGHSLDAFDRALHDSGKIRMALVVTSGFDDDGIWSRCECLRQNRIPFWVVSSQPVRRVHAWSIRHGAQGVLGKALARQELLALAHRFVVQV
ncbi:MAG TPA: response regulator [Verrucomicrobiae bacterium]|nr:response regulator [Verrucomicrobiae bacterium]